jgi:hypothetical protein
LFENKFIKKEQGAEGLVLGGGGDLFCGGKMGEEGFYFGGSQVFGVGCVMKFDKAVNPIDVAFFGAVGIVPRRTFRT